MAEYIKNIPGNLTEYPNSFKRQGAFPLEAYSVFTTLEEARSYATENPVAYVGQVIAVVVEKIQIVDGEENIQEENKSYEATLYIISDTEGGLTELGSTDDIKALEEKVDAFLGTNPDILKDTLDSLKEIQDWITSEDGQDNFYNLAEQVNQIYKETYKRDEKGEIILDENGNGIIEKVEGLLPDEITRATKAEQDLNGKLNAEIQTRTAQVNGLNFSLKEEVNRAKAKEQFILDLLFGKNNVEGTDGYVSDLAEKVDGTDALVKGVLGDFRGKSTLVDGVVTYEYDTVADFVRNATSTATTDKLGGVLSSNQTGHDLVEVIQENDQTNDIAAGQMRVIDLNVNKLYQTDYLILDGGTAKTGTFVDGEFVPPANEEAEQTNS